MQTQPEPTNAETYEQRHARERRERAEVSARNLAAVQAIAAHLPGGPWQIEPYRNQIDGETWSATLTRAGDNFALWFSWDWYSHGADYMSASVSWPRGPKGETIHYRRDYEPACRTRFRAARSAKTLAAQIVRNVIEPAADQWRRVAEALARMRQERERGVALYIAACSILGIKPEADPFSHNSYCYVGRWKVHRDGYATLEVPSVTNPDHLRFVETAMRELFPATVSK